jgi:DNA-binding PucR family transcriptional regulator
VPSLPPDVVAAVAAGAAADAGGLPVALLGDFLEVLGGAVTNGRPLSNKQLQSYRRHADEAARQGVALRALLDLYLSSAWRLWRHLPVVSDPTDGPAIATAGEVMLHAVDDVAAELAEGFQLARRALVRAQESARREFIDDLLTGSADVASVVQRADGFGMDLSGPHAVAVIRAERPFGHAVPIITELERAILGSKGDALALIAPKAGNLVAVFPAPDLPAVDHVLEQLSKTMSRRRATSLGMWQIGAGQAGAGADGVVTSYAEALNALELAGRLGLTTPVVHSRDLLVYQVLLRDQAALRSLIDGTLTPLLHARGGPGPLMETLLAYFDGGGNNAQTARSLHLSVRAVTYRLSRVHELTGHDPASPEGRLSLHLAVLGARLLDWPASLP